MCYSMLCVSRCIYVIWYKIVEVVICFVLYGPFDLIICLVVLSRSHFLSSYLGPHCTSFYVKRLWFFSAKLSETKLTFYSLVDAYVKDAIDLLQGHYIVSVGRDMTPSSQKGGLEAVAVSTSQLPIIFFIHILRQLVILVQLLVSLLIHLDVHLILFATEYQ